VDVLLLYVLLDIFSRYVIGWLIAERESGCLAEELIAESCLRQQIQPDQLTLHADRGGAMTAKSLALLMADLGVSRSHTCHTMPAPGARMQVPWFAAPSRER